MKTVFMLQIREYELLPGCIYLQLTATGWIENTDLPPGTDSLIMESLLMANSIRWKMQKTPNQCNWRHLDLWPSVNKFNWGHNYPSTYSQTPVCHIKFYTWHSAWANSAYIVTPLRVTHFCATQWSKRFHLQRPTKQSQ